MKKLICGVVIIFVMAYLFCEPDFSRSGGKTLDNFWNLYFQTKNIAYLENIIEYVDSDDALLSAINKIYAEIKNDKQTVELLLNIFEMHDTGSKFEFSADSEWLSAILLKSGNTEYIEKVKALYLHFSPELLVRAAVKSSAYWSLYSNAEQHDDVKNYLKKRIPSLSEKTRNVFYDGYHFGE